MKPQPEQWHLGDPVVQRFKLLIHKLAPQADRDPQTDEDPSINVAPPPNEPANQTPPIDGAVPTNELFDPTIQENLSAVSLEKIKLLEGHLDRLYSDLLPLLLQQITALCRSRCIVALLDEPESRLTKLLHIQSEIEPTMDQIQSIMNTVCPGPMSSRRQINDRNLRGLKSYRLHFLKTKFDRWWRYITQIFGESYEEIQQLGLSSEICQNDFNIESYRQNYGDPVALLEDSIESTIDRLKGSEFEYVKNRWQSDISKAEILLESVNHLLYKSVVSRNPDRRATQFFREPVIQLAKVALPIIKLSRLFFVKLAKRGLNHERLQFFTEMSSDQIQSLAEVVENVDVDFLQLMRLLVTVDRDPEAAYSRSFTPITKQIKSNFDSAMLLVLLYLVPLIPTTNTVATQDYYKNWLVTWNNSMILVLNNFELAAKLFAIDPY